MPSVYKEQLGGDVTGMKGDWRWETVGRVGVTEMRSY